MKFRYLAGPLVLCATATCWAQAPTVEWISKAKRTRGNCDEGATAVITQQAGVLSYKVTAYGKVVVDLKINLAPDGSGKTEYRGVYGTTTLEIPPGEAKRPLVTTQVHGVCQWTLEPT
jgi:hypothetical protein